MAAERKQRWNAPAFFERCDGFHYPGRGVGFFDFLMLADGFFLGFSSNTRRSPGVGSRLASSAKIRSIGVFVSRTGPPFYLLVRIARRI